MKTVSVGFDHIIHTYERGWDDGTIYGDFTPGAVKYLSQLMAKYAVVIYTARKPRQVATWIEQKSGHSIECTTHVPRSGLWNRQGYLLVTRQKIPSIAIMDYRAIGWRNWNQAMTALAMIERKEAAES